jgi:hypothetical protein
MRRTAAQQKAYRDRKRGKPPRPYGTKALVEQVALTFSVQYLVNFAFYYGTTQWLEPTPIGDISIKVSAPYHPQWLEVGGIKFRLQKWEALSGITDRWAVDAGRGKRYTKIYVLADGRIGCRRGLKLIYRTQQQTKKARRLKIRQKLIEQLEGGKRSIDYIQSLPADYVPKRRRRRGNGMRKRRYNRLLNRLLHPDRKSDREYAQRTVDEINRLLMGRG